MDISPDKQNIDRVFSNAAYYIDFYQRDYRWTDEPVLRLLDDIFFKFKEQYARSSDLDPSTQTVTSYYPWYYLNTYVTNVVDGRVLRGRRAATTDHAIAGPDQASPSCKAARVQFGGLD